MSLKQGGVGLQFRRVLFFIFGQISQNVATHCVKVSCQSRLFQRRRSAYKIQITTGKWNKKRLEIRSVERGICPIAQSTMTEVFL